MVFEGEESERHLGERRALITLFIYVKTPGAYVDKNTEIKWDVYGDWKTPNEA